MYLERHEFLNTIVLLIKTVFLGAEVKELCIIMMYGEAIPLNCMFRTFITLLKPLKILHNTALFI